MSVYTKRQDTIQYTETIYLKDGEEFARERQYDDTTYDSSYEVPMTDEEIDDWT